MVLALAFFAFQVISPNDSISVANDLLNFKFGLSVGLNITIIGNIIWYLLLIFTLRYFQVAVFIERQYTYLHKAEDLVNKDMNEDLITREGKSYLDKYPLFSNWMWALYTIVFPLLLLGITATKITGELKYVWVNGWSLGSILDSIAFVLLTISIILYLTTLHKKSKKKEHGV